MRDRPTHGSQNSGSDAKQPTISVCMIVKDEEQLLPGCLASIKAHVDEIIVVDTGSKDKTIEIAKAYGARVYEHPWEHDFSKHRNQSISYAHGEWVFIIDADEELVRGSGKILKKAVRNKEIDSIAVQIINPFNQGMNCGVFNSVRFFRRAAGIRYEGIVHNKEEGCRQTKFYPIRILHHGYNLNEQQMTSKFERTTALLKKKVEEDPQNPLSYHYLAASYLNMGSFKQKYFEKALAESLKAITLATQQNNNDPVFLWTRYIAATSYLNLEMDVQAEAVCGEALKLFPEHLDCHYISAKICDRSGNHERAKYHADCYFRIKKEIDQNPHRFGNIVINTYWNEWVMEIIRAKAIYVLGSPGEAKKKFFALGERESDNWEVQRLIGIFCFEKKAYKEAVRFLNKAKRLKRDRVLLFMLVECYGQLGETEKQIKILSEIMDCFPSEMDNIRQIGLTQFARLNLKLAEFCLSKILERGYGSKDVSEALRMIASRLAEHDQFNRLSMRNRPTISACLMVKNEEDCLGNCLDSIEDFVDEIIVVDTGSSDGTIDIARQHGARIYHHPWENDFSKHRNQSMSYAKGDWVLIVDADEVLDRSSGEKIREVARATTMHAILFKVVNCSRKGEILSLLAAPRLFRNHVGCHYRGIVHNQPHYPGEEKPSALTVFHYGYDLTPDKMRAKIERSEALLKMQIEQSPDLIAPRLNMAVSRFTQGDFRGAITHGSRAITLIRQNGFADQAYQGFYYIVSSSYFNLKELEKAEAIALEAMESFPENLDSLFVLMMIANERNDYPGVLEYGEHFIEMHEKTCRTEANHHSDYRTIGNLWTALLTLSHAYHHCGQQETARKYFEKACSCTTTDVFPAKERAKFCVRIGAYEAASRHLMAAVSQ